MISSVHASHLNRDLTQYINEQIKLGLAQAKDEVIHQMEVLVAEYASKTRQGCQSGVFGEHAYPEMKFPASGYITFNPPFTAVPALVYGLYLYDSSKDTNSRLVTDVSNLSKSGFNLKIKPLQEQKCGELVFPGWLVLNQLIFNANIKLFCEIKGIFISLYFVCFSYNLSIDGCTIP
ncbi:unnamed protein product [Mytilus coruscus]|uniref:H-type lectin domain-containing protein n=1 Tax=Mytilus coruscus TaxID=42192 RepID=A0A6J8CEH2_MYTCO|nr:unnamed protein product [Mytilus coruscus]